MIKNRLLYLIHDVHPAACREERRWRGGGGGDRGREQRGEERVVGEEVGGGRGRRPLCAIYFLFSPPVRSDASDFRADGELLVLLFVCLFTYPPFNLNWLVYLFIGLFVYFPPPKQKGGNINRGRRSRFRHVCDAGRQATDYYGP